MMGYKKGIDRNQISMYSLEDMVSEKAMVRIIDRFIEITDLEKLGFVKTKPAETGCPPYEPKKMAKLYVYGYENGVRSSRKLERETYRNVEVMWLMDALKPSYKTISEFRKENIRPLQKLFREFVKLCKDWGMVGGELVAVDGSKFNASNNKKNNFSRKKIESRLAAIDEKIESYLAELEAQDKAEKNTETITDIEELLKRKELYEQYQNQLDKTGENELSTVDPDAKLMGNNRGGVEVSYNIQSAVDAKNDIIIDFDVSTNPSDQNQLSNMTKKAKRVLKSKHLTVLADKGYYNGRDLLRVKKQKVLAIVARQNSSNPKNQPKEFHTENFHYNESTNVYICPQGHALSTKNKKFAKRHNYTNKSACKNCPHKTDCIKGEATYRTVTRSQYSKIYEETDKRYDKNKELYKRRQQIVEHPFGTIKRTMNGGYFLLRSRRKVRAEVALLFLGYNLKRVYNVLGFDEIMAKLSNICTYSDSFYTLLILLFSKNQQFLYFSSAFI